MGVAEIAVNARLKKTWVQWKPFLLFSKKASAMDTFFKSSYEHLPTTESPTSHTVVARGKGTVRG